MLFRFVQCSTVLSLTLLYLTLFVIEESIVLECLHRRSGEFYVDF